MSSNKVITTQGFMGFSWDEKRSTVDGPRVKVGTTVPIVSDGIGTNLAGHMAMYVQANGAIGASAFVTIDTSTTAFYASSVASATLTGFCRNGSVAFNDSEYGWVVVLMTAFPAGNTPPNTFNT